MFEWIIGGLDDVCLGGCDFLSMLFFSMSDTALYEREFIFMAIWHAASTLS
jgi:hypothetical protein